MPSQGGQERHREEEKQVEGEERRGKVTSARARHAHNRVASTLEGTKLAAVAA